jgi:sugar phosphate isomerase/epimerase
MYVASRIDPAIRRSYGSEWFREQHFENRKESLHALRKAREYYAELIEKSKNNPNLSNIEKEWMEYATNNHHLSQEVLVPGLKKSKLDIIDNEINNAELALKEARETITASRAERQKALSMIKDFVPIDDYAKKRSVDSFAKLGEYAYEVEKKKGLQKPIRIAMENIFPEMGYGSHPDELKDLVLESRKQMTDNLLRKNPKLNKKDAEKIAKDHIKATLDTEHMGMWKEYFYSKNPDKRDEEFNKWFLEKVNDLNDNGIIGNVHLVDTFGSGHVHLPVGEGSMPLKQAIQDLVKGGFKGGINSEGYSAGNSEQLFSAWRNIGTNVYASQGGKGATWTDVRKDNTFQRYKPGPYYVFGNYSPSQEWRPFSRMPLD